MHTPTQSRFSSAMSIKSEQSPTELDQHSRRMFRLNLDKPAQVLTFNHWSPDPWTIVGQRTGKPLATFSGFVLSVIKGVTVDTGQPKLFYVFALNAKSEGWSASPTAPPDPNSPTPPPEPAQLRLRLDFSNSAGGLLATFPPHLYLLCGTDEAKELTDNFAVDIFTQITSAHLSLQPNSWFWPC
jgi:hypothetical protein